MSKKEGEDRMTWNEYLNSVVAAGATPELAMSTVGQLMDLYQSYDWNAKVPFDNR